jgi:protein required for attachment to host cells
MNLAAKMWVAVIDGAQGIILENEGTATEPKLSAIRTYSQHNPPTREQARDQPGRVYDSGGQRRSSVEVPDLHRRAEDDFVTEIVADLEKQAAAGGFAKIVIAAPPAALGIVRKAMGRQLQPLVVKEIAADYTGMPVPQITAAVVKALKQ